MQLKMSYYKWEDSDYKEYSGYVYSGLTYDLNIEYSCDICSKVFFLKKGLYLITRHSSTKYFRIFCNEICRNIFILKALF